MAVDTMGVAIRSVQQIEKGKERTNIAKKSRKEILFAD